jgi:hypothetical protein
MTIEIIDLIKSLIEVTNFNANFANGTNIAKSPKHSHYSR